MGLSLFSLKNTNKICYSCKVHSVMFIYWEASFGFFISFVLRMFFQVWVEQSVIVCICLIIFFSWNWPESQIVQFYVSLNSSQNFCNLFGKIFPNDDGTRWPNRTQNVSRMVSLCAPVLLVFNTIEKWFDLHTGVWWGCETKRMVEYKVCHAVMVGEGKFGPPGFGALTLLVWGQIDHFFVHRVFAPL